MNEEKLIEQLTTLGQSVEINEDYKIHTRWHLERLVRTDQPMRKPSWPRLITRKVLLPAFLSLALLIGSSGITVVLAENSKPGDTLYPLKRAAENTRLFLSTNKNLKTNLRQKFILRRINELRQILPAGEVYELTPQQQKALLEIEKSVANLKKDYRNYKKDGIDQKEMQILMEDYQQLEQKITQERTKKRLLQIRKQILDLQSPAE